jgi:hypothetical protein
MDPNKLIDNILELPGVDGLFLHDTDGDIRLNRLPRYLGEEILADALPHLQALYEAADECVSTCDDQVLRFAERWLMLRRSEARTLLILGDERANLSSVRMVSNLALRHLTAASLIRLSVPAALEAPPSRPEPAPAPAPTRVRMYRGQPY